LAAGGGVADIADPSAIPAFSFHPLLVYLSRFFRIPYVCTRDSASERRREGFMGGGGGGEGGKGRGGGGGGESERERERGQHGRDGVVSMGWLRLVGSLK